MMTGKVNIPVRLLPRPTDSRGFIVPFFVCWFKDGKPSREGVDGAVPDFRVVDPDRFMLCTRGLRCWICGEPLGVRHAFVLGPMCCVTRVTSEPGSHRECAEYAVRVCPFLARPRMKRNPSPWLTDKVVPAAGQHSDRNPGVMAIWVQRGPGVAFEATQGEHGILFYVRDPFEPPRWYREGREATRAEIDAAIESGVRDELRPQADREGPAAVAELVKSMQRLSPLLPIAGGA